MNKFVSDRNIIPNFGPIGYITYKRSYSRRLDENDPNSNTEEFHDTVDRVINACRDQLNVGFTAQEEKELSEIFLNLKGSVAGRFWWQLGTKTVDKLGLFSLQNCAFCVVDHHIKPFIWTFDGLMVGAGIGFNIQKEHVAKIKKLKNKIEIKRCDVADADFIVPDSREGWVKLLEETLRAHFETGKGFTYSTQLIRSKGAPIRGFGGIASGPEELCWGIDEIHKILNSRSNDNLKPIDCLDIMNIIGHIVVSGNIRRSAQISIGSYDDIEFLKAKRWDLGSIPNWRSMSNNSVICENIDELPTEFWDTYKQGEPYGLINIRLSKEIGRIGETQYPDKNVEGYNPCIAGSEYLLTENGYVKFINSYQDGKELRIFQDERVSYEDDGLPESIDKWKVDMSKNGAHLQNSSSVFKTRENANVYKLVFNNGFSIRCTSNHKFLTSNGAIEAQDLTPESKVLIPTLENNVSIINQIPETEEEIAALLMGLIAGDGYFRENEVNLCFWGIDRERILSIIKELIDKLSQITKWKRVFKTKNWESRKSNTYYVSDIKDGREEVRISSGWLKYYLEENYNFNKASKLEVPDRLMEICRTKVSLFYLSGLFYTDGSFQGNERSGYSVRLTSISTKLLNKVQLILHANGLVFSLYKRRDACEKEIKGGKANCKTTYELISNNSCHHEFMEKIAFFKHPLKEGRYNQSGPSKRKGSLKFKEVSLISYEFDGVEDVYCLKEDLYRNMTVNGISVTRCAEQSLEDKETCCLSELFLPNIESKEELIKVAKHLYRINKHSLALKCHQQETQDIVNKNMRMGIGITGVAQCPEYKLEWLDDCYKALREFDVEYSKQHNFPTSIKLTTVKPSGSLSLLPGVTPGAHPSPAGPYYIRRIRIASNSPLIEICKNNGYFIEPQRNFDGSIDQNTMVVEFPCCVPEGTPIGDHFSSIEQLELIKKLQTIWSDNSVSVTVYYKLEDLEEIKQWLRENYRENTKSVSFLLYHGHGFDQAPYETITKEMYEEMVSKTSPIQSIASIDENSISGVDECANGSCPIK